MSLGRDSGPAMPARSGRLLRSRLLCLVGHRADLDSLRTERAWLIAASASRLPSRHRDLKGAASGRAEPMPRSGWPWHIPGVRRRTAVEQEADLQLDLL